MEHPAAEDKNWAWVLDRPCPECGFDRAQIPRDRLAGLIRANGATWRSILGRGPIVAQRPPDGPRGPVWSALEYACHARDVYETFAGRLTQMLSKNNPTFPNWDADATAQGENYLGQDPSKVGYQLALAAGKVADILDRVRPNQWDRPGTRSDGQVFTVESMAAYLYHDVQHHLVDVEQGFKALNPDNADDADADVDGGGDADRGGAGEPGR